MYKFLLKFSLFTIFLPIGYAIMIFLIGLLPLSQEWKPNLVYERGGAGHTLSRLQEIKEIKENIDILFLGSSHTYRGFDPRNFENLNVFNLGSSSQSPMQTKTLLNKYIDQVNPRIVIYEVYPSAFSFDGIESSVDIIANEENDFHTIKMVFAINHIKTYNTLLYAILSDTFSQIKSKNQPVKLGRDTYILGGYVESDIRYYKFQEYKKQEWLINKTQLEEFNECLKILEKRKIRTILLFAPITPKLYQSFTNNDYIDSLFNSYKLEYYNFNKLIQLNDSIDFYDADHLNQIGVNKFNKKIIDTIDFSNLMIKRN